MNKAVLIFFILTIAIGSVFSQSLSPTLPGDSYQTPTGVNFIFKATMLDSTGTYYSDPYSIQEFNPRATITYPSSSDYYIPVAVIGTGTKDSVKVTVQTRMKKTKNTWSTWKVADTVVINFNKVDGYAYWYNVDFNGQIPDQFRFAITGASSVNRANVVITAIAILTKVTVFQLK